MSITVRYFASIRERVGKSEDTVSATEATSVADVWRLATGIPWPDRTLAAVNQEYAGLDQPVRDGDEVAFFPPVTGG